MQEWIIRALNEDNPAARGMRSDYDLNKDIKQKELIDVPRRDAAVLVPIVNHKERPTVLLTKRQDHLKKHPGQVSFPGGTSEEYDRDFIDTALRETEEEVGLDRSFITIAGQLDGYHTGTGFKIVPVVGIVQPGFSLTIQESEVAEAFEVPLDFLLDRDNHRRESAMWKGIERHYYAMPYRHWNIWGATAAMLVNLCDVLEAAKEKV